MGEMADYTLDQMMDVDEEQQRLMDLAFCDLTDVEHEFMYDYDGTRFPLVFSGRPTQKPHGPGKCPECGAHTVKRTNHSTGAVFYGCSTFPECRGSRDG